MFNPMPGKSDDASPEKRDVEPAPSMPASYSHDPDIDDEAYTYALESLLKGTKPSEIRKSLVDAGYSKKQVDKIIETAKRFMADNEGVTRPSGGPFIFFGLLLWGGGVFLRMAGMSGAGLSLIMLISDVIGLIFIVAGIVRTIRRRRRNAA